MYYNSEFHSFLDECLETSTPEIKVNQFVYHKWKQFVSGLLANGNIIVSQMPVTYVQQCIPTTLRHFCLTYIACLIQMCARVSRILNVNQLYQSDFGTRQTYSYSSDDCKCKMPNIAMDFAIIIEIPVFFFGHSVHLGK